MEFLEILPWVFTSLILIIGGIIFWFRIINDYLGLGDYLLYLAFPYVYKGWSTAKKHHEYQSEKNHHAIIVAHKRPSTKPTAYADGVDLLINFFKNKEPYKVYHCSNSNDFKRVLENKKAMKLWIFGHGSRHTLSFGKKDRLYYCDVRDYPAKEYIAQFHCNDGMGKSLADYLSPKNNFVTNSKRDVFQNRKDIKKILKEKRY